MRLLRRATVLSALALGACDPNVVDAVRAPAVKPEPVPDPDPDPEPDPDPDPDPDPGPMNPAKPPRLVHRYSFEGTGTAVVDSQFQAHGEVVGAELPGYGTLPLSGVDDGPYVNLPNGLLSKLSDATFEAWVTWNGGAAWQRIFDFGNMDKGEDAVEGGGKSYFFLTASSGVARNRPVPIPVAGMRLAYSQAQVSDEEWCHAPSELPVGVPVHVAVVVNQAEQTVTLYLNGAYLVDCELKRPLSAIDDRNNWLGRSNFAGDARFDGIFDEFRIYDAALTDEEIAESAAAGPDADL